MSANNRVYYLELNQDNFEKNNVINVNLSDYDEYIIKVDNNVNCRLVEFVDIKNDINVNKKIILGKDAKLEIVTIEVVKGINNVINVENILDSNSYIINKKISLFEGTYDSFVSSNLNGENAKIETTNVLINSYGKVVNTSEVVNHNACDTISELYNYGICKNVSTININTNGYVVKDAKRSNLRQKSKGILLDEVSSISANPWLQIDEFDCLASHGAGIGAIDEEDLYYLMSRGLTKSESEKLIINGFVDPVYASLDDEDIKNKVIGLVKKFL